MSMPSTTTIKLFCKLFVVFKGFLVKRERDVLLFQNSLQLQTAIGSSYIHTQYFCLFPIITSKIQKLIKTLLAPRLPPLLGRHFGDI